MMLTVQVDRFGVLVDFVPLLWFWLMKKSRDSMKSGYHFSLSTIRNLKRKKKRMQ